MTKKQKKWVYDHPWVPKCAKLFSERAAKRYEAVRKNAEARTAMKAKRRAAKNANN